MVYAFEIGTASATGVQLLESTGTFLHDGALFSLGGLDRKRRFWRKFFTKAARVSQRRTQGKKAQKLNLKSLVIPIRQ